MHSGNTDKINLFEQFIDRYCSSVFSAMARLTGSSDEKDLETMTVNIFLDLWKNSDELFNEIRPAAFIYKILLQHVFNYLKGQGNEDRALLLRNTLLIDPFHYLHILAPREDRDPPKDPPGL